MFVIGTAGHVDHGKSALVQALTGIDPDRLREEKTRGMTIDLGFAWLTLPSGREVSIVDVPGHERFIKNMLAGAGGIDLALLVVAADDGVMPQTREHLAILDLLGVKRGVVALTKSDLGEPDWLAMVESDVNELLAGTALAGSPIVRCSAITRAGLGDLLDAVDHGVAALPAKRDIGRPRLPIDRVFTIAGFGTVVTGTLVDGALEAVDEIEVVPGGMRGRIRGLQCHRDAVQRALPGMRTAVNIAGIARDELRRGMVLSHPGLVDPATVIGARLRALAGASARIRHGASLMFHCGADEAPARLRLAGVRAIEPGEEAWAQLTLARPVALARGDRFVLRTAQETIGGGIVVDTTRPPRRRVDALALERADALLAASPEQAVLEAVSREPFASAATVARAAGVTAGAAQAALAALAAESRVVACGEDADAVYLTREQALALRERAIALLSEYHTRHHLRRGMALQEFRARLGIAPGATDGVLPLLGVMAQDAVVALPSFRPAPTVEERATLSSFVAALGNAAGAEPLPDELFAYAVQHGIVVDAGNGVLFAGDAFASLSERVAVRIRTHGSITLAEARDLIGTGRKQAQALLEEMDRRGVTRRTGDTRVLRRTGTGTENGADVA